MFIFEVDLWVSVLRFFLCLFGGFSVFVLFSLVSWVLLCFWDIRKDINLFIIGRKKRRVMNIMI